MENVKKSPVGFLLKLKKCIEIYEKCIKVCEKE